MKFSWLFVVAAVALTGCAPTLNSANERGGIVENLRPRNVPEAFQLADAHCRQYKRVARISQQTDDTLVFDCVAN